MTVLETGKIMSVMQAAYPRFYAAEDPQRMDAMIRLWAEMFRDVPYTIVNAAVKVWITGDVKGFPPSVGQIMDKVRLITDKPGMDEGEAWSLVLNAIRNSAYNAEDEFRRLPYEIQLALRVPAQLREWAVDEHFNSGVEGSNFKRVYRTCVERRKEYDAMPADVRRIATGLAESLRIDAPYIARIPDREEAPHPANSGQIPEKAAARIRALKAAWKTEGEEDGG